MERIEVVEGVMSRLRVWEDRFRVDLGLGAEGRMEGFLCFWGLRRDLPELVSAGL